MYFDHQQTLSWAKEIVARCEGAVGDGVEVVLIPSFPSLQAVAQLGVDRGVKVGAQDVFWEPAGPYTGEVSAATLAQVGCTFVEIGHAERRQYFGDDDDAVAKKFAAALRHGITPILCIGEVDQVPAEAAVHECLRQLRSAFVHVDASSWAAPLVVAYEPSWAIGSSEHAQPDHVRAVACAVRNWLAENWGASARVVYGGSAGTNLLEQVETAVDGLFLGRYAHDPDVFSEILDEATKVAHRRGWRAVQDDVRHERNRDGHP